MSKARYTMIELLVVMSIIVVLAGSVLVIAPRVIRQGRIARTKAQIDILKSTLDRYFDDYGYYPQGYDAGATENALDEKLFWTTLTNPQSAPYIDFNVSLWTQVTVDSDHVYYPDAFGNPFYYVQPGVMNPGKYDLWSMGPDGRHGRAGVDDNGDGITDDSDFPGTDAVPLNDNEPDAECIAADSSDDINNFKRR